MKRKLILVITSFCLLSCVDLHDEPLSQLTTNQFYRNESDAVAAVNAIYNRMFTDGNALFNRQIMMYEMSTDDYTAGARTRNAEVIDMSKLSHAPKNLAIDWTWSRTYDAINRANIAIEKIAAIPEGNISDEARSKLINEAKFLRGWNYFNLVRWHGRVPLILQETTSLERENLLVGQASEEDLYQQIIADLQDAENLPSPVELPASEVGRATAGAAKALLIKVYLTQKKWEEAAAKAKELIDLDWYSLFENFAEVFRVETKNGKEHIFSAQFKGNIGYSTHYLANVTAPVEAPFNGDNIDSPNYNSDLYESFSNQDARKSITFVTELTDPNTGVVHRFNRYYFHKYWDPASPYNSAQSSKNVPILRYADVLLMYAEALNELGNRSAAYESIDLVRKRAKITPLYQIEPNLSLENFRDTVFQERRKEFVLEFHRWFDLSRRGAEEYVRTVKASGKNNVAPRHAKIPIPQRELDVNPNLEQLEQWKNF